MEARYDEPRSPPMATPRMPGAQPCPWALCTASSTTLRTPARSRPAPIWLFGQRVLRADVLAAAALEHQVDGQGIAFHLFEVDAGEIIAAQVVPAVLAAQRVDRVGAQVGFFGGLPPPPPRSASAACACSSLPDSARRRWACRCPGRWGWSSRARAPRSSGWSPARRAPPSRALPAPARWRRAASTSGGRSVAARRISSRIGSVRSCMGASTAECWI